MEAHDVQNRQVGESEIAARERLGDRSRPGPLVSNLTLALTVKPALVRPASLMMRLCPRHSFVGRTDSTLVPGEAFEAMARPVFMVKAVPAGMVAAAEPCGRTMGPSSHACPYGGRGGGYRPDV